MHKLSQLGMVGTTYRRAGQAQLAHYTLAPDAAQASLKALAARCGLVELVYLSTCNRVEWIFVAKPGLDVARCRVQIYLHFHPELGGDSPEVRRQAARNLHAFAGEGAAEHLFVVAASLDSMVPGEAQILGQVKASLRQAEAWHHVGPDLRAVFEEAFAAAKRVRADTRLGRGVVSMLSLALEVIEQRLAAAKAPRVLAVVGVGDMAQQCGATWQNREAVTLLFVNRTLARAQALAEKYGGKAMALATFLSTPPDFCVLVTSTAAPEPLFDAAFFAHCTQPPWVIDLAVMRDVCPDAIRRAGGVLYDIDRLKSLAEENRHARNEQMALAREVIDEMLASFRRRLLAREMAPVTQALRARYATTLETSLGQLLARELHDASPAMQTEVTAWAQRLVNKLAHIPTHGLKQIGYAHGPDVVQTFLDAISVKAPGNNEAKT